MEENPEVKKMRQTIDLCELEEHEEDKDEIEEILFGNANNFEI